MTKQEYEEILSNVGNNPGAFRQEIIKILWDLTRAIKGGLDD